MKILQKIVAYLIPGKKSSGEGVKPNGSLKMMHGINRISILMFLFALIVLLFRYVF